MTRKATCISALVVVIMASWGLVNVVLGVIPDGFEPSAYCLEGSCSIQLSYETKSIVINEICRVAACPQVFQSSQDAL